ncbi:hypothetical protein ACFVRB_11270 [Streptomyces nojiriensis]|uniref:hypothetical protein n=1 Tax=Streptomyces nojiriensis TaxID=66374 RepID=UPI0036DCE3D4
MSSSDRRRRRNALRHVPVVGRGAAREYWEDILNEPPPESPTAPGSPEPPDWMLKPVPVLDARTQQPAYWADDAPYQSWAARVGEAKYKLMLLDGLSPDKEEAAGDPAPWAPIRTSGKTPLSFLNHPTEVLTVAEREALGATGAWTSRSWAREAAKRKKISPDQVAAGLKEDDLPEAECSIAPWWDE